MFRPVTVDVSSYGLAALVTANLSSPFDCVISVTSDFGFVMRDLSYPDAVTATRGSSDKLPSTVSPERDNVPVSRLYTVKTVESSTIGA